MYKCTLYQDNKIIEIKHFVDAWEANNYNSELHRVIERLPDLKTIEQADAEAYLLLTDWYIIRELDIGVECPAAIKQKRAEARGKL
jgi:hypothetical protein